MQQQAERFGTQILDEIIVRTDFSQRPFTLMTDAEQTITADSVIICTGASPRKLGVPGEDRLANRGVSYCATCDGFFFRDKRVVVVGGGNSALDEALFLTRFVSALTIVHRRDALRADSILQERAFDNPKIQFAWDSVMSEVIGEEQVSGVRLTNVKTKEERILETDGVFIYVGHVPNTELFRDQLPTGENGYLVTDSRMRTTIPGVYGAGDVVDHIYRQAITAAGQGCMAGMEVIAFLAEQDHLASKAQKAAAMG
jgi:thioredoxin reductase (NADPH)